MKTLLTIFALTCLTLFTSCSSTQVNDFKVSASVKAQTVVANELKVMYADVSVAGVDCSKEADEIGQVAHDKVFDLLKAKETLVSANMLAARTPAGAAVYEVCNFLVSQVIPGMIKGAEGKYVCLKALSADALGKASSDLCGVIKF